MHPGVLASNKCILGLFFDSLEHQGEEVFFEVAT